MKFKEKKSYTSGIDASKLYCIIKHCKETTVSELVSELDFPRSDVLQAVESLKKQGLIDSEDNKVRLKGVHVAHKPARYRKKNVVVLSSISFFVVLVVAAVFLFSYVPVGDILGSPTLSGNTVTEVEVTSYDCSSDTSGAVEEYCLGESRVVVREVGGSLEFVLVEDGTEEVKIALNS
jgi:hypothetical protein